MKQTAHHKEPEKLTEIYELMCEDTERAWTEALAALKKYKSNRLNYTYAKAQMIAYILARETRNKLKDEIDSRALLTYFESHGHNEDACMLTLNMIRDLRSKGQYDEAHMLDVEYERKYKEGVSFTAQINRIISIGNYKMMRELDKTAQLQLALRAEAMLRAAPDDSAWYRVSLSLVLQLKAEALSHTTEIEKVRATIAESVALVDIPGISLQYIYTAYYFKGNVAANSGREDEALESYYLLEKRFEGHTFYHFLLIFVYLQIFKQLNVKFSSPDATAAQKEELLAGQLKYIALAQSLPVAHSRPYLVAYLSLSEARLMRVTGQYQKAISCLAKALRVFVKNNITNHIIDIYEEAYLSYEEWAEEEHDYTLYSKAIRTLKYAHELTYRYNQTEGKEKMDALINQYELRQKELNEKLLHQKMDAMNKEIQMAAFNLHEKVKVLDELKIYVTSLKKKGQETNQLINAIAKKIDAVIITEQDKTALQQKIDEGNKQFFKVLSDKYPSLSNLEIQTCGLLKTGMTNKDLSKLYGQSEKSYEQHRYRIKKKLGLTAKENLVKYLSSIV